MSVGCGGRQKEADRLARRQTECPPASPSPVYKARLESVEASASNPYVYYHMQLQAVIKSGMCQVAEEALGDPALGGST